MNTKKKGVLQDFLWVKQLLLQAVWFALPGEAGGFAEWAVRAYVCKCLASNSSGAGKFGETGKDMAESNADEHRLRKNQRAGWPLANESAVAEAKPLGSGFRRGERL